MFPLLFNRLSFRYTLLQSFFMLPLELLHHVFEIFRFTTQGVVIVRSFSQLAIEVISHKSDFLRFLPKGYVPTFQSADIELQLLLLRKR